MRTTDTHAGLCRSDLHVMHGDLPGWLPLVLGHEGARIVEDVGAGVARVEPGDHVVCSFIPSCGHCHWCATGRQNLCDMGANIMRGYLPGDSWPLSGPAGRYGAMCMLGTFSQYGVVHETSVVKIDPDLPLERAALVGCCAALWGRGGIVLADRFEVVSDAPEELEPFLAGAWPIYEYLDLTRVEYHLLETVRLTDSLTRVLVRYSFFDGAGVHLVDGDFEYVLRREGDELRCHVGVNISAEPNLAGLARSRGCAV